jgi:hypothetical protein
LIESAFLVLHDSFNVGFVLNKIEVAALCAYLSPAAPQTIAKETFKQWWQSSNRFACVRMTDAQIAVYFNSGSGVYF